ncbi:hypothetical protein PGB90_006122 [Kerria lacca]
MNTLLQNKNGLMSLPFQVQEPSYEEFTSTRLPFKQPSQIVRFQSKSNKSKTNKWYRKPEIPVQVNLLTLIRMKSKNPVGLDELIRDKSTDKQLVMTAKSFLKRNHRMSEYNTTKSISPFNSDSCIKDISVSIVANQDVNSAAIVSMSANPFGDGTYVNETYHRVSAFSVNDHKSGCNVKYMEQISVESKRNTILETKINADSIGNRLYETTNVQTDFDCAAITKISKRIRNCDLDSRKSTSKNGSYTVDQNMEKCDEEQHRVDIRKTQTTVTTSKKILKKNKKPVVVTCLKNSSLKFVRKKKN